MTKAEMYMDRLNRSCLVLAMNDAIKTVQSAKDLTYDDADDADDADERDSNVIHYTDSINLVRQRMNELADMTGDNFEVIFDELYDLLNDADDAFGNELSFNLLDSDEDTPIKLFMKEVTSAYCHLPARPHKGLRDAVNAARAILDEVAQETGYYIDWFREANATTEEFDVILMLRSVHTPFDINAFLGMNDAQASELMSTMLGCELFSISGSYSSYEGNHYNAGEDGDATPVSAVLVPTFEFPSREDN